MFKFLIFFAFISIPSLFLPNAFSVDIELQQESERIIDSMGWLTPEHFPLQEQLQILIDQTDKKNKITIGLLSTDSDDIKFPKHLERVMKDPRINSFTLTNKFACAPNQIDKGCVIIEVERTGLGDTILEIKDNAREIADNVIEPGVIVFAPIFYASTVEIKTDFEGSERRGVVQVVYTTPRHTSLELINALSPMLVSSDVISSGGFYNYAKKLSEHALSEFSITLVPLEDRMLRSLHISLTCSNTVRELPECDQDGNISKQIRQGVISPLDFIQLENIHRSKIFDDRFLPFNSVIQVLILADDDLQIKSANSNVIEKLDSLADIQENGWFFLSESGEKIDARYIFGKESVVNKNDLIFSINYANTDMKMEEGGGCLIATAAFGTELAPQIQHLRELRDDTILQTEYGSAFMASFNHFYYSFSPAVADYERENPMFRETVKLTLTPLLTSLTLLQYADINSESDMLGYGIGMILLNIGMYFAAPTILIMTIKKRI